ncbi:MAG: cell wall metabolism sensor histidine kinase WalK [Simkaniaceae bacterium]
MKKLNIRNKLYLYSFLVFLLFTLLFYLFGKQSINYFIWNQFAKSTETVIEKIKIADSLPNLINNIKLEEQKIPFQIILKNANGEVLYISKNQGGYVEQNSKDLFAITSRFEFLDKDYVLQFIIKSPIASLILQNLENGFFRFTLAMFFIFGFLQMLLLNTFLSPLKKIASLCTSKAYGNFFPKHAYADEYMQIQAAFHSLVKKAQNDRERLKVFKNGQKALFECLPEGIIFLDKDQRIIELNLRACKFLGEARHNLLKNSFLQIQGKNFQIIEKCQKLVQRCQSHLMIMSDAFIGKGQKKFYMDILAIPVGQGEGSILILQDNSSHYKMLEMGKDFVANASHELRTPITIIKGFSETLRDLPEISEDMLNEIIDKIVRNCHRMNHLIKNLLLLADLDYLSRARMQKKELIPIIENCCHTLLTVHPDVHIETLYNKENIEINADSDLFELAIYNLLENAVKYSSSPAKVVITMEEKQNNIQINIQDQGKGIPKQDLAHIFDRFYTVNKAHSRKLGGAGLGLSIVKTIIEKHEGNIEVASELHKGTNFQIVLPKIAG